MKFQWEDQSLNHLNPLLVLIEAVNKTRIDCGIEADVWLHPAYEEAFEGSPNLVSSARLNVIRRAIEELYRQKGLHPPPSSVLGNVFPGETGQDSHIADMRKALDDLVVTCSE